MPQASLLGQGEPVFRSDLGSGWGSAVTETHGGHKAPLEMRMCVDKGFVMAGGSLVSVPERSPSTVLSVCPGLASALKPVQTSTSATGTSGVTLLLTSQASPV